MRIEPITVPIVWDNDLLESVASHLEWHAMEGGEGADTSGAMAEELRELLAPPSVNQEVERLRSWIRAVCPDGVRVETGLERVDAALREARAASHSVSDTVSNPTDEAPDRAQEG